MKKTSPYVLFIDDEREPPHGVFVVVRDYDQAVQAVSERGLPEFISFDHDLGEGKSGYDFAKWLVDYILDNNIDIRTDFDYYVHSQNPVGRANIYFILDNLKRNLT